MRLIFLHGIHQNGRDPAAMTREWIADLEVGLGRPGALSTVDVVLPFYGDALVAAAQLRSGAIAQGGRADADRELARFLADGLEEQAAGAGVPRAEIAAEQEAAAASGNVVPQGFPMDRRINAIVNILERISPLRGDLALRLLGQAHAYLRKPHVRRAVDDLVRPALAGGPMVLVSHSLGTIVGFALLREAARAGRPFDVPLFVTLGSPLTLATVQRAIGPSFTNPAGTGHWLNLRDPDDFISLNRDLSSPPFGPIENVSDFDNPGDNAHAIPGYLTHSRTAQAIAAALKL
jgi:hypothetical protein